MENLWKSFVMVGKASHVVPKKLKMLKNHLRRWDKKVFDIMGLEIETTLQEMNALDFLVASDSGQD